MTHIENISRYIDAGDPQRSGEVGNGSHKITAELVGIFYPAKDAIKNCELFVAGEGEAQVCGTVTMLSIEDIPAHGEGRRHKADMARRGVCVAQRVCPVSNHFKENKRVKLPCMAIRNDLENYLGKI